jgi:hypothetical protein
VKRVTPCAWPTPSSCDLDDVSPGRLTTHPPLVVLLRLRRTEMYACGWSPNVQLRLDA